MQHSPRARSADDPQFLDHRPHRSRQVDARRPVAGAYRYGQHTRHGGAVPRRHGARARARHHDQGACGAAEISRAGRRRVPTQPDRHAGARRLLVRGVAQPRRVRGRGRRIRLGGTGREAEVNRLAVLVPSRAAMDARGPGEVGAVMAGIKEVADTQIGDTVTDASRPTATPLPGFKQVKPMVFAGLYPAEAHQYGALRDAVEKLRLNDSSFTYEPENSVALGFGFRCGFLGLLHMEIIQERLEREFALTLITTAPTVAYRVYTTDGRMLVVDSPAKLPPEGEIERMEEPFILVTIHVPTEHLGNVIALCEEKRGKQRELKFSGEKRALLVYELPLNEIVLDFYDRLKSASRGYASLDYEPLDFRDSKLVKLDVRINGDIVDALSVILHSERAYYRGRELTQKMRELVPRQMFEVVIQAAIGNKVIARETVKALRKNVTAKCYGGDITRKRKLLERQKEGKRRMKQVGRVEIPQEAFLAVLKVGE